MTTEKCTNGIDLVAKLDSIPMNDFERSRARHIALRAELLVSLLLLAASAPGSLKSGLERILNRQPIVHARED